MRTNTIKLSLVGIAAFGAALMLAAIAMAQAGDGDGDRTETPGVASAAPSKTPDADEDLTPAAPSSSTVFATPPADASDELPEDDSDNDSQAAEDDDDDADEADDDEDGDEADDEADGSIEGTTPALNPGGHCVELPNDSDVVQNPDKHSNWVVGGCEPGDVEAPESEEQPGEGSGPPEGRTPSLNPEGVCVALPNNSDVVRNPDKHPNWTVGGCELPAE